MNVTKLILKNAKRTFGESQYAYLVIDQQQALVNLAARKPLFIEILVQKIAIILMTLNL